jgi:hypothetical protein
MSISLFRFGQSHVRRGLNATPFCHRDKRTATIRHPQRPRAPQSAAQTLLPAGYSEEQLAEPVGVWLEVTKRINGMGKLAILRKYSDQRWATMPKVSAAKPFLRSRTPFSGRRSRPRWSRLSILRRGGQSIPHDPRRARHLPWRRQRALLDPPR